MSTRETTAPLARATDPETSHDAARALQNRSVQKAAILKLLRELGPMTDHQLISEYTKHRKANGWPNTQLEGVRKRRAELKNEGLVKDSGRKLSPIFGWPASIVWEVAE